MAQSLRFGVKLMVVASFLLAAGAARAKGPPDAADPYEAARDAQEKLDYKTVIREGSRALDGPLAHDKLINLYQMLGTAYAALGKTEPAIDAFTRMLAIDPDHHLPRGTSPKINGPFREAGGYWVDRPGGLQVQPTLPREILAAKPLAIPIKLDDPLQMTATVRMNYRLAGDPDFNVAEAPVATGLIMNIPEEKIVERTGDYALEIYFTALSAKGGELRFNGDPGHPLTITVHGKKEVVVPPPLMAQTFYNDQPRQEKRKPPAFLKKWWFWTAIGAGVAIAVGLGAGLGWYFTRDTSHIDLSVTSKTAMLRFNF